MVADRGQDDVAHGVAEGVVDVLEVVDVKQGQREGVAVARRSSHLHLHRGAEGAAVEEAGQGIAGRALLRLLDQGGDAQGTG